MDSVDKFLACCTSLVISCGHAGGDAPAITSLEKMTALELLKMLAANDIRFVYAELQCKKGGGDE